MRVPALLSARFLSVLIAVCPVLAERAVAGPALLFEVNSGKVLYAEDLDDQWHPASLTKIMTAYVVFSAIKSGQITRETKFQMSDVANAQPPSKIGLPVGAEMTVETALQALIVKSANDIAVMLAEGVGGNEDAFVERMNKTAAALGMSRTHYVNANGLPADGQITTARDLAIISRAVLRDFPEYAHYWAMADMHIGRIRVNTHNGLLRSVQGADGMKTGFICDSGYNVVASASRDGLRMVAVVLGENSSGMRNIRATSLLEHGFQTYGWKTIFDTATIKNIPIAADAHSVGSVRGTVMASECGWHHPRVARKRPKPAENAPEQAASTPKQTAFTTKTVALHKDGDGTPTATPAKPRPKPASGASGSPAAAPQQ